MVVSRQEAVALAAGSIVPAAEVVAASPGGVASAPAVVARARGLVRGRLRATAPTGMHVSSVGALVPKRPWLAAWRHVQGPLRATERSDIGHGPYPIDGRMRGRRPGYRAIARVIRGDSRSFAGGAVFCALGGCAIADRTLAVDGRMAMLPSSARAGEANR